MSRTVHVVATLACALIALAGWWDGCGAKVVAPHGHADPVATYNANVNFLKNVAKHDVLWEPVLREKVNVTAAPAVHVNRYTMREQPATVTVAVDPFDELVQLMRTNAMVGTQVAFVAAAVRVALECTVLKHVSIQALVLHGLIAADPAAVAVQYVIRWLEHMARLAADKLAALGHRVPVVAEMHSRLIALLLPQADLKDNALHDLALKMYNQMEKLCTPPATGQGQYSTVVQELKRERTVADLNHLHGQLVGANVKGLDELDSIDQIVTYSGKLGLADDIHPDGFAQLGPEELRKVAVINRIQMNYLLLNLPLKAMAEPQWNNLYKLKILHAEVEA